MFGGKVYTRGRRVPFRSLEFTDLTFHFRGATYIKGQLESYGNTLYAIENN